MGRTLAVAGLPAVVLLLLLPGCKKEENIVAPTLVATCDARPASGNAPLPVAFLVGVAGASGAFSVAIEYGDGTAGTNPDVTHTYGAAGTYTASFTVTTATQSARCSAAVIVSAAVSPQPTGNEPPAPVFKSTPAASASGRITGTAPLSIRWNMCASADPDHDILWFLYDFDGDGRFDREGTTGAYCRTDYVYSAGTWNTKLCVHDESSSYEQLHANQCRTYIVTVTP